MRLDEKMRTLALLYFELQAMGWRVALFNENQKTSICARSW